MFHWPQFEIYCIRLLIPLVFIHAQRPLDGVLVLLQRDLASNTDLLKQMIRSVTSANTCWQPSRSQSVPMLQKLWNTRVNITILYLRQEKQHSFLPLYRCSHTDLSWPVTSQLEWPLNTFILTGFTSSFSSTKPPPLSPSQLSHTARSSWRVKRQGVVLDDQMTFSSCVYYHSLLLLAL